MTSKFEAAIHAEPTELIAKWRVLELLGEHAPIPAPEGAQARPAEAPLVNDDWAIDWLTLGAEINRHTANLVVRFARALAAKLAAAEKKYGYSDGWRDRHWEGDCRAKLLEHIAKGDPRDVAAYCAFMWHHSWSTAPAPASTKAGEAVAAFGRVCEAAWSTSYGPSGGDIAIVRAALVTPEAPAQSPAEGDLIELIHALDVAAYRAGSAKQYHEQEDEMPGITQRHLERAERVRQESLAAAKKAAESLSQAQPKGTSEFLYGLLPKLGSMRDAADDTNSTFEDRYSALYDLIEHEADRLANQAPAPAPEIRGDAYPLPADEQDEFDQAIQAAWFADKEARSHSPRTVREAFWAGAIWSRRTLASQAPAVAPVPLTKQQIRDACYDIYLSDHDTQEDYDEAIARAVEKAQGIVASQSPVQPMGGAQP